MTMTYNPLFKNYRSQTMSRLLSILIFIATLASCASTPSVPPVTVGDAIDVTALKSQHGESFDDPSTLELMLYVNGMAARDIARASIKKIDIACLNEGRVAYVADISGMPSFITSLIAVPRMREYPYPMWLDYDGAGTDRLPAKDRSVTVMDIEQGQFTSIEYIAEESALTQRLSSHCLK